MNDPLQQLLADGVIDEVVARLKSGKEADLWLVQHAGEVLAAKVYKDLHARSFRNNAAYKEGRQVRDSRTQRAMERGSRFGQQAAEDAWKAKEWEALNALHAAGVRVPRPVMYYEGVLLMEAVVDAQGHAAPRLVETAIPPERAGEWYADLRQQAVRMLCCDLIHGDLSPYNVLLAWNGPTVIDFPQVIGAAHNSQAERFFERDLETLRRFFAPLEPTVAAAAGDAREIWRAYVRRELTPEFVPTGRVPAEPARRGREGARGQERGGRHGPREARQGGASRGGQAGPGSVPHAGGEPGRHGGGPHGGRPQGPGEQRRGEGRPRGGRPEQHAGAAAQAERGQRSQNEPRPQGGGASPERGERPRADMASPPHAGRAPQGGTPHERRPQGAGGSPERRERPQHAGAVARTEGGQRPHGGGPHEHRLRGAGGSPERREQSRPHAGAVVQPERGQRPHGGSTQQHGGDTRHAGGGQPHRGGRSGNRGQRPGGGTQGPGGPGSAAPQPGRPRGEGRDYRAGERGGRPHPPRGARREPPGPIVTYVNRPLASSMPPPRPAGDAEKSSPPRPPRDRD